MFGPILAWLSQLVMSFIESLGYFGIFFLMVIESANAPIPSEIILPFAGFLATKGVFSFWWVVFWGTVGNLVGSLISYALAAWLVKNRHKIFLVDLIISDRFLEKSKVFFKRYGNASIFFSRVIPVIRTFISLPAGIARMNLFSFSILTFGGAFIWSFFLAYLGWFLGEQWQTIEKYFHKLDIVIVALLVVGGAYWARSHFSDRIEKGKVSSFLRRFWKSSPKSKDEIKTPDL